MKESDIKHVAEAMKLQEDPFEPSEEMQKYCKEKGIVILFGGGDDLMEFRGAINDEVGCWEGGDAFVDSGGLIPDITELIDEGKIDGLRAYFAREPGFKKITAIWGEGEFSWTYETDIPHETFDIMEDNSGYCRGIVFDLNNLEPE